MILLRCLIEGDNETFTVEVPRDIEIEILLSHVQNEGILEGFKAIELALWKVDIDLESHMNPLKLLKVEKSYTRMEKWNCLSAYWPNGHLPADKHLHIFLTYSEMAREGNLDSYPLRKRQQLERIERFDLVGSWMSRRANQPIPAIQDLLGFIEKPLSEDEKIPVSPSFFDKLTSTGDRDVCDLNDFQSLFKVGEPLEHKRLHPIIFAVRHTPFSISDTGTENSFTSGWDLNIRGIIESLELSGSSNRNRSCQTQTRKLRPDYSHIVDEKCVFRGEENGPESSEDPREELASKLEWVYDPAPYVFGYYCKGPKMTLCALVRPSSPGQHPAVHDLVTVNLQLTKDRISNVCHLINLAGLLRPLATMIQSNVREFFTVTKENSEIQIAGKIVVKKFRCKDGEARVKRLEATYHLLRDNHVPNVDQLLHAEGTKAHLTPRGIAREPSTEAELRQCLSCILDTLIAIHKIPFFHRDIRWNNIICRIDDPSKWLLIDWEDAASPPTTSQKDFNHLNHSPAIFQDNHNAEVDIWGVGHLITTCNAPISVNLKLLGEKICKESSTLTAFDIIRLLATSLSE